MARIRSVKPEFWDDRKLAKRASRDARLLYIALWNLADEWGRLNGDPQWIKGQAFPYDDDLDAGAVAKLLNELENPSLGAVVAYEADGDPYLFLPKLAKHQRLEPEKVPSRLPAPSDRRAPDPDDPQPPPGPSGHGSRQSEPRADSYERRADEFAPRADAAGISANKSALLYVAGGREQGAGSRAARAGPVPNAPAPRFTEVPDDFEPTDAMRRWAHATHPGLDLDFETQQFIRYWRSEGRSKKSWVDAWQKWIADSHKRMTARASPAAADRRQQATDALFERAAQRIADREARAIDPA